MAQSNSGRLRLVLSQLIQQIRVPKGHGKRSPYPKLRNFTLDVIEEGSRQKTIHLLLTVDIGEVRKQLEEHRRASGEAISLTSYIAKCFASAIENDKRIQARRLGKSRIMIFDDVDLAFMVEREWEGEAITVFYIVRRAHQKTAHEIHRELQSAKKNAPGGAWTHECAGDAVLPASTCSQESAVGSPQAQSVLV